MLNVSCTFMGKFYFENPKYEKLCSTWTCVLICYHIVGTPSITDCVMAELERLGQKYRVALR